MSIGRRAVVARAIDLFDVGRGAALRPARRRRWEVYRPRPERW
jgi:hypothetical protein